MHVYKNHPRWCRVTLLTLWKHFRNHSLTVREGPAHSLPRHSSLQWQPQLSSWPFVHLWPASSPSALCPFPWRTKNPWSGNETPPTPQMEMIFSKAHFNWTWRSKSITVHSSVVMNMIYVYKLSRATSFFILMLWKPDMPQRKHLLETRMKERSGKSHFIIKASLWCPRQSKA